MGTLARKIVASVEVDSTGAIWLKRTQQIWDGDNLIAPGNPHRQQIAADAKDGIDAFGDGGIETVPLKDIAGDRWPALSAIMAAQQEQ